MNERRSLAGKAALVTGATRGIGQAAAAGLAEAGASVAVAGRKIEDAEAVAGEISRTGGCASAVQIDVRYEHSVNAGFAAAMEALGRIDILVNCAGISPVYRHAELTTVEQWDDIVLTNLRGTYLCCMAAGREMIAKHRGAIVNMGSVGGSVALERLLPYCASKGGVEQITKVLAVEWARHNIRVNCVAPAFVETDLTRGLRENDNLRQALEERTPMKRMARPDEVVDAILYLASDAASYVTGHTLFVDGGWTAA